MSRSGYPADLYNGTPPHQSHSSTSSAAAVEIIESAASLRRQVYLYLKSLDGRGATDEQISDALAMLPNTERPRRRELVLLGKVKNSCWTRRTRSGRRAVIWICHNQTYRPKGERL